MSATALILSAAFIAPWICSLWSGNGSPGKFDNTQNYWCDLDGIDLGDDPEEDL
ncbi:MAG: hypothetical protein KAX64_00565 [Chromatiaceae bacterium]|nr:hypothetical protein [Chromatiaceae bacterium]